MLEVVEQEQHLAVADVLGEAVLGAERLGDSLGDERRIAERGKPDPEDAGLVLGNERRGRLDREPRLAGAAGARERDEPGAFLQARQHLSSSSSRPTNELAGVGRFVLEIVFSGGKEPFPS